ncbi:protein lifeguard 2-like [Ruditapes philippinarum]|uniref:protein lifeguard 2-like n=1 Tax=Ruditapes philippinarum TaxID=129788 RepID=UPI00295B5699|nr:protein lifeguard 2-like [Ruditapes philippinarum]
MSTQYPPPNDGKMPPPPAYSGYEQYPQGQGYAPPPPPAQSQTTYGGFSGQPTVGYSYGNPDTGPSDNRVTPSPSDMFDDQSFSNKVVRRGFIKKVYLILFTQLLVTFGCTMLFSLVKPIKEFCQSHPGGTTFYYVSYGTFFVTYFVLICIPSVRRKHPGNFICLSVFTLAFTYMVATISSFYTTNSVMVAAGITCAVCLGISLFAIQTKIDFTLCSGLLFALCLVLILFGFSCIIVYATIGYSYILDCVYGGLAALVFSLFLIYDTQMIVGGRKHEMSPEEYVYGALQLYIDVVYLFLIILSCFGKSN